MVFPFPLFYCYFNYFASFMNLPNLVDAHPAILPLFYKSTLIFSVIFANYRILSFNYYQIMIFPAEDLTLTLSNNESK